MSIGLQALAGEVARVRAECDYFLRTLGQLESQSRHSAYVTDAQEHEIERLTGVYADSVRENLERATDDLHNWSLGIDEVLRMPWWPPLLGGGG